MPTAEQKQAILDRINKEESNSSGKISRSVISAGDAYKVGLLDDKYKIPYLETKYPDLTFQINGNKIMMSRDNGQTFINPSADPKYKISSAVGTASPFVIGIGSGIAGGVAAGPPGALVAGGVASAGLQAAKESIESEIDSDVLKKYGMNEQNGFGRAGDIALAGAIDVAGGHILSKVGELGGMILKQPVVQKQTAKAMEALAKTARKAGSISDEFMKPRQELAKQVIGADLVDKARLRNPSGAGERIQKVLQDKVDTDDLKIDSLWDQARDTSATALKDFNTLVDKTRSDILAKIPFKPSAMGSTQAIDEGTLRKMTADKLRNKTGYLFDFSTPYRDFLGELRKAAGSTGAGVNESIIGDINNALKTSRAVSETGKILSKAGNKQFSLQTVTGEDLYTLRKYLGERIGKATSAGDNNLKRVLTNFKNKVDVRLSSDDVPGSSLAKQALEKQKQSYIEFPEEVRLMTLTRPSRGIVKEIDPEAAFENVLKLKSNDRKLVGNIVQATSGAADELAQDVQAKAVLQGALQPKPKLNATKEMLDEAKYTTKGQLATAIDEGHIPNTAAVKNIQKGVGEETIDLPSKTAFNYLTSQKGSALADIMGADNYQNILKPIKEYTDIGVLSQSAKQSTSKTGQQVITDTMQQAAGPQGQLLKNLGNIFEGGYRPLARATAATADELGSARSFSNAPLNVVLNAARGGGNQINKSILSGLLGGL